MNKIINDYNQRRIISLRKEIKSCESQKDFLLDKINFSIRNRDICHSVIFLNSIGYQEYLDKISLLNPKILNLKEKESKLTRYPFQQ